MRRRKTKRASNIPTEKVSTSKLEQNLPAPIVNIIEENTLTLPYRLHKKSLVGEGEEETFHYNSSNANNNAKAEQLEKNLQEMQVELGWHKTLTNLIMEELNKTRAQVETLKKQVVEITKTSEQQVIDENRNWQTATNSLKDNYDKELARKQKEVSSVHELLAQWIVKYMDLERNKGVSSNDNSIGTLFKEYILFLLFFC